MIERKREKEREREREGGGGRERDWSDKGFKMMNTQSNYLIFDELK